MFPQLQQVAVLLVAQQEPGGGGSWLNNPLTLIPLFFAIFYFIYIRPASQDRKKHEDLVKGLKRGDEVVLQSGIIGKVGDISDKTIHLELARNVKMEVLKTAVVRRKEDLKLSEEKKTDKAEGAKSSKK